MHVAARLPMLVVLAQRLRALLARTFSALATFVLFYMPTGMARAPR